MIIVANFFYQLANPDYLLYGRMFFPGARLEAMYVRRLSEHLQYLVTAVNSPRVYNSPQVNKKK